MPKNREGKLSQLPENRGDPHCEAMCRHGECDGIHFFLKEKKYDERTGHCSIDALFEEKKEKEGLHARQVHTRNNVH